MESVDIKKPTFWELNKDAFSSQLKGTTTPNTKKYIITVDKSIQSTNGKTITLNKGDIIQGIEISSFGNMANDSGSQSMTFEDKNGNRFSVGVGYRGFQPFFEENKSIFDTLGLPMVTCPDGTKSIANGIVAPCFGKSGNQKPTPSNKYRFVDTFTDYAMHDFIFKKNDVIIGEPKNQSSYYTDIAGNVNVPAHILFTDFNTKNPFLKEIQIPLKYVVKVDDSTITTPIIQISQQPQNQQRRRTFYEMNQGYIFIGLGLVAGYFAYKKFKN